MSDDIDAGPTKKDTSNPVLDSPVTSTGGIQLAFHGRKLPWQVVRKVMPRRQVVDSEHGFGPEDERRGSLILEGECLQALVSLHKYRGQVDFVLADPPYNTGEDFRFSDEWDDDPNRTDEGTLVSKEDGSKHTKWLRYMEPRLWMMKEMLRPSGVLAICIDHRELFRLGVVLDQMFGEENRLAIINWQKTTVKNDARHVSTTTEYVLAYAKSAARASTRPLPRTEKTNSRFSNPDDDPDGKWQWGDLTAATPEPASIYQIQSPFTGELHPPGRGSWAYKKSRMKDWLEEWGTEYAEVDLNDGRAKGLVLKGWKPDASPARNDAVVAAASKKAKKRLAAGAWPLLYWADEGRAGPAKKHHLSKVKNGAVPTTFWADDLGADPFELGSTSWHSAQSGRTREAVEEQEEVLGSSNVQFETAKPLQLVKKLISIWCPPAGIVLDPFAGAGTTGHAVLELNREAQAARRFVLIESRRTASGQSVAQTVTSERVRRVVSGNWASGKRDGLGGGFRFAKLADIVDARSVLALRRDELVDLLTTSHWDQSERAGPHLRLVDAPGQYLFAVNQRNEGHFLVWTEPGARSCLDRAVFRAIAEEAQGAGLSGPYHVYARTCAYDGPNIDFAQLPDCVLAKLGVLNAPVEARIGSARAEGAR